MLEQRTKAEHQNLLKVDWADNWPKKLRSAMLADKIIQRNKKD